MDGLEVKAGMEGSGSRSVYCCTHGHLSRRHNTSCVCNEQSSLHRYYYTRHTSLVLYVYSTHSVEWTSQQKKIF